MQLYLVHCGFYDNSICDGIYESHVNLFVVARSFEEAKAKAKSDPVFKDKRMHVDGLQEIRTVHGYDINLEENKSLQGDTVILSNKHRDLAPKAPPSV
ncbi:MAG: DUF1543 domain-containing protein [Bdellovibrionales bacterium]|nr:DUF1543 domain-containing protein [Bdellovibrionales bacterium]